MSNCPFYKLVGKLWGGGGPPASASAASANGAVCPLGFGAPRGGGAPSSTSTGGSKCPLGFGGGSSSITTPPSIDALPRMTLAELQAAGPSKGLVSVKGLVFDVSARREEMAPLLGHDCSRFFALGGGGGEETTGGAAAAAAEGAVLLDHGLEGLGYDQVVRVERVLEAFLKSFAPPVAALGEADRRALFGAASMAEPGGVGVGGEGGGGAVAEKGWWLHELIEQGAGPAAVEALLSEVSQERGALKAVVNCACPRTGLSPLHKAVENAGEGGEGQEAASKEVLRLLVARGADLQARAALYDGDTPVQLARRMRRGPEVEALLQP